MASIELLTKGEFISLQNKLFERIESMVRPEKEFITESELIGLFNFNKSTLAKMRMNGEIPYYKFGGKLFYKAVEVNRIIERNQVG